MDERGDDLVAGGIFDNDGVVVIGGRMGAIEEEFGPRVDDGVSFLAGVGMEAGVKLG